MPRDGAATRKRILDAAERLVIDGGFAATSVDAVIAASRASKGAFFHHFPSKTALAQALVERYAAADRQHLLDAVATVEQATSDPVERVLRFVDLFVETADDLMAEQSSCLYVAVLTERQLAVAGTDAEIRSAIQIWRDGLGRLLRAALPAKSPVDVDALADHVFVTFEGAFILCRATGDPTHMRRQLATVRLLLNALLA